MSRCAGGPIPDPYIKVPIISHLIICISQHDDMSDEIKLEKREGAFLHLGITHVD